MILYGGNSGLIDDVYFLTATSSASFNSARVMVNINTYYDLFVNEILDAQDDWDFNGEIAVANIVANQRDYGFPTDILKPKRLEIKNSDGDWYNAQFIDINEKRLRALGTSADINDYYSSDAPAFGVFDNQMYLYPTPDTAVNSGLKLWYDQKATSLTANTMEPLFNSAYHRGLSFGASKDWFQKIGDLKQAKEMEKEMEKIIIRMKEFYAFRLPDREYRLKTLTQDYE